MIRAPFGNKNSWDEKQSLYIESINNAKETFKKPSKNPKVAKKVTAVKSSESVSAVVVSKPTEINNEIESLKNSVAKLNKTKEVKVAKAPKAPKAPKAVVVKPTKTKAVKVNNTAKKSPVVKIKAPAKVVAKVESKEPQA